MIKKGILITSAVFMAASFFSGCAGRKSEAADRQITEQNLVVGSKEDDSMEVTAQSVCIDYVIESYENVQKFGYELLAQNIRDKNPVLSPVSAYLALSMAACGADGVTRDEFYKVLGNDMMSLCDDIMNTLPTEGEVLNLSIADSVWIDDAFIVDDTWIGTIKSLMDSEVFQENLSTVETMNRINNWIGDKTNGLIDEMLTEPLDVQTRFALFNTVYFKGKWMIPFEAHNTCKEDFYLDKGQDMTEQVDMMNLYRTDLDYIATDLVEGVILPYQRNDDSRSENLAFVALKPVGDSSVRDVYRKLTSEVASDILVNKQTGQVNLKLPKFEITFDKVLNDTLSNMGLVACFDANKADFDRMGKTLGGNDLYIDLVRQKAKIIVDEEGTEAAAVTEVLMSCGAIMETQEPKEIYFNEPFIYIIMEMDNEIPLFIGIMDDPVS